VKLLSNARPILRHLLHPSLREVLISTGGLVLLFAFLGIGPWSPFALDRANRLLVRGDAAGAIRTCERIAVWNPLPGMRREARYRAALLQATEAGEPGQAATSLWNLLAEMPLESSIRPEALTLLASTLQTQLGRPGRAARLYEEAAIGAEDDPRQSAWTLAAADAFDEAGQSERAAKLRARVAVSQDPRAGEAWLALGRSQFAAGSWAASFDSYQHAVEMAGNESLRRLARFGVSLALEHMGESGAAVTELDEAIDEEQTASVEAGNPAVAVSSASLAAGGPDERIDPPLAITRDRIRHRAAEEAPEPSGAH
jgi:tetratricopeptide (TPR) repeat protein